MVRSKRTFMCMVTLIGVVSSVALGRLPGTLNFQNLTGSRINQTVAETASNEKEVDFGDFDKDGDLDVLVANGYSDFGQRRNKLYRNDAGVFNEVSGSSIVTDFVNTDVSRNGFFQDYDGDTWLDFIIVNDDNTGGDAGRTKVFMNQHPGGVFSSFLEDGNARLGPGTGGAACSGVSVDIDNDGDFDLYVGNYPGPSQDTMYTNSGSGFFTDVTSTQVPADGDYTVDVASGDMNGDGKVDILVANWGTNYIYYNNNGGGSGPGDYRYSGSADSLGSSGANENSMESGDFNGDGMMDFYWANAPGGDKIYINTGNTGGQANFSTITPSDYLSNTSTTRKATVEDLNLDGRPDLFVMVESGRPVVLRNTSVNGNTSFVDWTPGDVFPSGTSHAGWHAAAFNADTSDNYPDLFIGAWVNDRLFQNVDSNEVNEVDIGGVLPSIHNTDPVVVSGSIDGSDYVLEVLARSPGATPGPPGGRVVAAGAGQDTYSVPGVPTAAILSVVLNGCSDFSLEVLDGATPIATSDRGGLGIEEALQVTTPSGTISIRVTLVEACVAGGCTGDIDCVALDDACAIGVCNLGTGVCEQDVVTPTGSTCRAAANDCDTAEICDGINPTCPADVCAATLTTCDFGGLPGVCDGNCTCIAADGIPTVSEWGLAIMTLLFLSAGTIVYRRRRPIAA